VGQRVSVYWSDDRQWYNGVVVSVHPRSRELKVRYDDGQQQHEALWELRHKWLPRGAKQAARNGPESISRGSRGSGIHRELYCHMCAAWRHHESFSALQARPDREEARQCLRHSSTSSFGAAAVLDPDVSREGEAEEAAGEEEGKDELPRNKRRKRVVVDKVRSEVDDEEDSGSNEGDSAEIPIRAVRPAQRVSTA